MDGKVKKTGSKRGSKIIDVGIDADDDEPIGSLFKLKRHRNPKKAKVRLESGGEKGQEEEIKEEKLQVLDDGSGGMDDTLASFRKKLKGHKKVVGSGTSREKNLVCDGPTEVDSPLNVKSTPEIVQEGRDMVDGGSDTVMVKAVENSCKRNVEKPRIDSNAESNVDGFDDESKRLESKAVSLESENKGALTLKERSNNSSSQKIVESLLEPDFTKKSYLEHKSVAQISEGSLLGGFQAGSFGTHQSVQEDTIDSPKSVGNSCIGSCRVVNEELVGDGHGSNTKEGLPANIGRSKVLEAYSKHDSFIYLDDSASAGSKRYRSETEAFQERSKICHADGESTFGHGILEYPASEYALDQQQSGGLSTAPLSSAEPDFHSLSVRKEVLILCSGDENPIVQAEQPDSVLACSQKENIPRCHCRFQVNHQDVSLRPSCQKCIFTLSQSQTLNEETVRASLTSVIPGEDQNCPDDMVLLPDTGMKESKSSAVQRPERNAKKCKLGDMAYEGDVDWETLVNEQGFLETQSDRSFKGSEKFVSPSNIPNEAEISKAAAVAAGLKARSVSAIEKIKFKEVLKRKGGLQEYLYCRNYIFSQWGKNISRVLPITDCGVSGNSPENELPRPSLIREVYKFLDQRGYINVGVSGKKDKEEPIANHTCDIFREKKLEESSVASVADSEDGVAFILGQVKTTDPSLEGKNGIICDDADQVHQHSKSKAMVSSAKLESTNTIVCELLPDDQFKQNGKVDADLSNGLLNSDAVHFHDSAERLEVRKVLGITSEAKSEFYSDQSASYDHLGQYNCFQGNSEDGRKIIVIGAGPAGLTAARHLQRQGFCVTVVEARSRIGGRVYTDRSSLSVPVDLGASIITGIEADVASERMPDPSALVCTQLGLELTVLHGFCPLYDIVTGQKVPADLDDALQAEFNSLIDDVDLLVEQIGIEQANRMSLEDGLEYGLRRHRLLHDELDIEKIGLHSSVGSLEEEILSPLERRVMNWHFAHTEYGCAAVLKEVSLPNWNQDEYYGGFGGPHAMIKGGYSAVVESLGEGLDIRLNHAVTEILYSSNGSAVDDKHKVKVCTSNGSEFLGAAVLITVPLGCLKAETIKFSPSLPDWKYSSIKRLGFGVLNKVILEFPHVFWDDSLDYFGATAEETDGRGECFMFWNVKKTVGAPVLIALVVGKAAINSQKKSKSDHVNHAMMVLYKLFSEASVPNPVASVVTDWGSDPYSYGAYSYVAIGASGEDYDIVGRPIENCLFFAGEATCKEHPDTVGGAMLTGLREAVRIIDIFSSGNDYTAEAEAMDAAQRKSVSVRDEVRDLTKRLEVVELSNVLARQALLRNMFFTAKTTVGRLHLAKELLNIPVEALKSFAGTKEGLTTLNSWILDSMGKNGTQLLRHCVHILVHVSSDLFAVRMSGIGKTVKEKVCAHTSRDIRAIASQLVSVWLELFRKEKVNGGLKSFKQASIANTSRGKATLNHGDSENKERSKDGRPMKLDTGVVDNKLVLSEEEQAAFAAAEAARAAAEAAAKAFEANRNASLQLPKIPSFHKFARREQYAQMDESELRKLSVGVLGRQDCLSEIDSRNCKVRDWYDFPAACLNLDSSRMSVDNHSLRSHHSNEISCHSKFREHSGESAAADCSIFTRAWVDSGGSEGFKDYHAIERWQSQAAAADPDFFNRALHIKDEEESNISSRLPNWTHDGRANESSISQVTVNKEPQKNHPRGADRIKQAVVDFAASLLMPLYKARKIDRDDYKSIMKKTATKVMEQATDAEKAMTVPQFLDSKRKNKIRDFVDKLIERHMARNQVPKP